MKRKELKDLRSKSVKELAKMVVEKKIDLKKKALEGMTGKDKNIKNANSIRREVAQIMTFMKELEILEKIQKEVKTK